MIQRSILRGALLVSALTLLFGCLEFKDKKEMEDAASPVQNGDKDASAGNNGGDGGSSNGSPSSDGGNANGGGSDAGSGGDGGGGTSTSCSAEVCNDLDDDCDTVIDEGCAVDECAALPCLNGGTCADGDGTFTCTCAPGFEGATCEKNVDECAANPCQNGGACVDGVNTRTCMCPNGFSGPSCEYRICGTLELLTRADIDANRACTEIQGDLSIGMKGFASLTSADFPNLKRVSGSVTIGSQFVQGDGVEVQTVVFGALESIGGTLAVGPWQGTSPRTNISFLSLQTLGGGAENALSVSFTPARSLLLPALKTIQGNVVFSAADELCAVNFSNVTTVTGSVDISAPLLFYADIEPLVKASQVSPALHSYDCCVANTTTCSWKPPPAPTDTLCRCR